jgi:lysophospholipase L1-like esterase
LVAALLALVSCTQKTKRSRAGAEPSAVASGPVVRSRPGLIVVLGSSTSAGTGPSNPKNAWVERYRAYLQQRFPDFALVNLAVGGQTTYHIQPTGFVPAAGRAAPRTDKNISAALALRPSAVIVNMPSNDAAASIPISEQVANYERVAKLASDAGVLLWVSTSQPRNFDSDAQHLLLSQARDAINIKLAPRTLDFWTPFADASGNIESEYDSGDGVHLNDAAHARLFGIVVAARVPEAVLLAP